MAIDNLMPERSDTEVGDFIGGVIKNVMSCLPLTVA